MDFPRFNLKWWTAAAFAAGALACSAQEPPTGEAIIFSKPADDGMANPSTSLQLPPNSAPDNSASGFNLGAGAPLPMPTVNPDAAWQKALNNRKNWTLMTPEQIMGVQTPEQIFGLPERDADKNLSPEEQYLKRQENATAMAATNAMRSANGWARDGLNLPGQPDANDLFAQPNERANADASSVFSKIFNTPQSSPFDQNTRSSWTSSFALPAASKTDLEQAAAMDRFRALIGATSPQPNNSAAALSPAPSSSLQPLAQFDPFGHPLANAASALSKPTGLTTLPQLTGSYTPPATTKKPSWEPQSPPWLSDGSTPPSTPPIRKFY